MSSRVRLGLIELHGWDARVQAWHGPTALEPSLKGCASIARKMRASPGSWYGRLQAEIPGEPRLSFYACVHDLGDAALGVLDLEGSAGGPLHFVLVVPAQRRRKLRAELAFEFMSFARFLEGPENRGSELTIHDYIESALHGPENVTLVFSMEARVLLPEVQILLAQQADRLTTSMIWALAGKDDCTPGAAAAD